MIHHLARAFFVRESVQQNSLVPSHGGTGDGRPVTAASGVSARPVAAFAASDKPAGEPPLARPVRPRPITPWSAPSRPAQPGSAHGTAHAGNVVPLRARRVRICTDPSDARRTVIAGRFAEVCAALDRLVREQEAAA